MARFWILSDLHQEYWDNRWDSVIPTASFDAIIAAGDICGAAPDAVRWLNRKFSDHRIVYVPGNHCYWQDPALADRRKPMGDLLDEARDLARTAGIDLLSDDSVVIAGTRICGSTLWTNYRCGPYAPATAMRDAEKGMNDYKRIRRSSTTRPTKPIRAVDLLTRHCASVDFLDAEMGTAFDGATVVVTHHAPHPRSLMVQHDDLNPAYASDLTWLIARNAPALWVHGHVHVPSDYMVDGTRIVCNPRGYSSEIQQQRWVSDLIVEV